MDGIEGFGDLEYDAGIESCDETPRNMCSSVRARSTSTPKCE